MFVSVGSANAVYNVKPPVPKRTAYAALTRYPSSLSASSRKPRRFPVLTTKTTTLLRHACVAVIRYRISYDIRNIGISFSFRSTAISVYNSALWRKRTTIVLSVHIAFDEFTSANTVTPDFSSEYIKAKTKIVKDFAIIFSLRFTVYSFSKTNCQNMIVILRLFPRF